MIATARYSALQSAVWTVSDAWVMTRRNLLRYLRLPQLLVFSSFQPVMFMLLFNYVFGGAVNTGGLKYIDFLLPGILIQTVVFGSIQTGVGLAEDLTRGMVDRFRSLPMARSAVLAGRTAADTLRNVLVVLLMTGVGTALGFRFQAGPALAIVAPILAVAFGFAFSWVSAFLGMSVKDAETAQVAGFVLVFPLVFASSQFVPIETMPGWLQAFAKVNPVTAAIDTSRALTLGGPLATSLWKSLVWTVGIAAVFAPLAVYRYRRAT
jgi:ABC-2 type transport system permease protein/oleandomycin transport system permease protein